MAEVEYALEAEDEGIEVELEDLKARFEREKEIVYADDDPNLVKTFLQFPEGKNVLKDITARIVSAFTAAHEATKDYRERCARDWRLLVGELEKPTFPFEDCAAIHIPSYLESTVRLTFRAEDELFGDWRDVFRVSSLGPDDDQIAEVMTIHDNWQLRNQVIDFKRQLRRGILAFFSFGDVTYHSYWDELRHVNVHEMLTPDTFVMPYAYTSVAPDLSDLPWYAKIFHRYRHDLQAMRETWHGVDRVIRKVKPSWDDEPAMALAEAAREAHGVDTTSEAGGPAAEDTPNAPFRLVHWEGWLELPNQDRDRFCYAIFEPNTKALMCLKIHEEPDWQEAIRAEQQAVELDMYKQSLDAYEQAAQAFAITMNMATADADARVVAGVLDLPGAEAEKAQMAQAAPQQPAPPQWLMEGQEGPIKPRSVPIRMFRHAVFIEPLQGNLGYGYGRIGADMNIAQDTMIRQYVDATTLRNCNIGFVSSEVELPEDFGWRPGKFFRVEGLTASQLQGAIMPFNIGPPSEGLLNMVDKLYQWQMSAAQAPDVLSGASGKSGETFRGHAARIEQATKMLAVPTRKFAELLTELLKNNAKLNSMHLEDDEVIQVTDMPTIIMGNEYVDPNTKQVKVGRWMWERSYHVEIQADLRFTTRAQRIQEADEIVSMGQHPLLMQNMEYQITALKKALIARGRQDMAALIVPPAPPPMAGAPGAGGPGPSEQTAGPPQGQGPPMMGPPSAGPSGA